MWLKATTDCFLSFTSREPVFIVNTHNAQVRLCLYSYFESPAEEPIPVFLAKPSVVVFTDYSVGNIYEVCFRAFITRQKLNLPCSVNWCTVTSPCPALSCLRLHWSLKTWLLQAATSEWSLLPLLTSLLAWVSSFWFWLDGAYFLVVDVVRK